MTRTAWWKTRWGAAWLFGVAWPLVVWGQGPAPAPAAPSFSARNYFVDAALFVVLAGAAIYAVVRSSKRV